MHRAEETQVVNTVKHPDIQIAVENFGPIEKAEIELRPLTVFVGESNTGKTYFAALIYALHRIYGGLSRIPWSHSVIQKLYFDSLYSLLRSDTKEEISKVIEKQKTRDSPLKFSDLPLQVRDQLHTDLANHGVLREELKRCFDLRSVSNLIRFTGNPSNDMKVTLQVGEEDQSLWSLDIRGVGASIAVTGYVNKDMVTRPQDETEFERILGIENFLNFLLPVGKKTGDSYYLPAARSGIMQSHGVIASSLVDRATSVGLERFPEIATFSGMIADFLKHIINYKQPERPSGGMIDIAKALETEVVHGEIEVRRPATIGYPEFLYRPQKTDQALRMSHSSSMVSELAPLVLFLRGIVQPGDTLIIEEPESHLHPAAQTKMALTLARLVRAGVRVIITTHSDWLLEQIGNLVREGEVMKLGKNQTEPTIWLTKEEVGAWWFREDKPVKEIAFEHIAGIEPEEYGEVAEKLYNRSVDLRTQLENITGGTEVE